MTKKKKAVALKYNLEQDMAPVVIASGYGEVAERIINIAEGRGIPVYRDDSAASMLCMLEVGAAIPEELYQVVATIYVQIMETANRLKEGMHIGAPAGKDDGALHGADAGQRTGERVFGPMDAGVPGAGAGLSGPPVVRVSFAEEEEEEKDGAAQSGAAGK
jgi:flagellar biosynthesis protein